MMVLICISILTNVIEKFFMCLVIICTPSLVKYLFKSLSFFTLGGFSICT